MKISPSQVVKFRRCQRAYAFEYVEGITAPSSPKQQFGSSVHKELEAYLRQNTPPAATPEGEIARAGLVWLPTPGPELLVENKFTFPWGAAIEINGIIDCAAPPGYACEEPLVIDHKTTSDLKWAKTAAMLENDEQAIIYSVWAMLHWNVQRVRARWVYYAATNPKNGPRKPRGCRPIEVLFDSTSPAFAAKLDALARDIGEISIIRTFNKEGLSLPPSPQSCRMFEGCFYSLDCNLTPEDTLAAYMDKGKIK
jgi:RecB family exonuclease